MHAITVRELYIYPIKSARGIAVDEAMVTDRGLGLDRRFMVVDGDGQFITQRQRPELSQVEVRVHGDALEISAKGAGHVAVPLRPEAGVHRRVHVWGDPVDALSLGEDASRFFERCLGVPAELVYMPDSALRPVDPTYAPSGENVSFADSTPFLLIAQASLDDLNARLAEPVPMNRFRPNIVVDGAGPFDEDDWDAFAIGEVVFQAIHPCARCTIVTIDQATGVAGQEPLATLSGFRRQGKKVLFGQGLIHRGHGVIRVGDHLRPAPAVEDLASAAPRGHGAGP